MVRGTRRDLAWIASAFLLLCVISAYRQISRKFFVNDIFYPAIVYFVYLVLLTGWHYAIRNRITQRNIRFFLLAENVVILIGMTIRFIQDAFLYHDTQLMRISGYWVIIPIVLFPLFGLYAALGLGKADEYRIRRNWYYLLIPTAIFIILLPSNELHHLVFRLLPGETRANLYFHPNIGVFVIIAWALALMLARVFIISRRSRALKGYTKLRSAPLFVIAFMLLFNIPYLSASFVVNIELIEYTAFLFFLEAMVWESCIIAGMVPVNTHYKDVFDRSSVDMRIVDEQGRSCLKSVDALELPAETFEMLKQQMAVRTEDGQEIHLHPISGGYAIWQNDVSQTTSVINEIRESVEKLEHDGDLLNRELHIRSVEAVVREQIHIYNQLTSEIGQQLLLLKKLLGSQELGLDKEALFRKICLVGTYIKRRCNLRLIEQSDGSIPNKDLELCFHELASCLSQMGVEVEVQWNEEKTLAPEFAIFALDFFEFLLEHERFELGSIKVAIESDATFSIQVETAGLSHPVLASTLHRINKQGYELIWQDRAKGYIVRAAHTAAQLHVDI